MLTRAHGSLLCVVHSACYVQRALLTNLEDTGYYCMPCTLTGNNQSLGGYLWCEFACLVLVWVWDARHTPPARRNKLLAQLLMLVRVHVELALLHTSQP